MEKGPGSQTEREGICGVCVCVCGGGGGGGGGGRGGNSMQLCTRPALRFCRLQYPEYLTEAM